MGLLVRELDAQTTSIFGLGAQIGVQSPPQMRSADPASLLHYQASINNSPLLASLINNQMSSGVLMRGPSQLDWDGVEPTVFGKFPYLLNLPS